MPEIRTLHKNTRSSVAILLHKMVDAKPTSTMFIEMLIHYIVDYRPWQDLYQQGKCLDVLSSTNYPYEGDRSLVHFITQLESGMVEKFPVKNVILSQLTIGISSRILERKGNIKIYAKMGFTSDIKGYSLIFEETSDHGSIDDAYFRALFQHAIVRVYTQVA